MGRRDEAPGIRTTLVERWQRDVGAADRVTLVFAGLGNLVQAFAWLDRSIAPGPAGEEVAELLFGELHRDPRFDHVRERLALQT